jgi:hypothetical protein
MSARDTWYVGRFARRRGVRATVDVLAVEGAGGWEPVTNPRKLFPKSGQVELVGPTAIGASAGEWLKFKVLADPRPGLRQSRVGANRMLPRFADVRTLGTVEAARFLLLSQVPITSALAMRRPLVACTPLGECPKAAATDGRTARGLCRSATKTISGSVSYFTVLFERTCLS